jgi:hypothetical protein
VHDGETVAGVVSRMEFFSSTFPDGADFGTRDLLVVVVT